MENSDYSNRSYLSAIESAKYLDISVKNLHTLEKNNIIKAKKSASGQKRFDLKELKLYKKTHNRKKVEKINYKRQNSVKVNQTLQQIIIGNSQAMKEVDTDSIHLIVTSPPYFNTKMYSNKPIKNDLGNIHNYEKWFDEIGKVWKECYRVLQPGRKIFINIMNLPIRTKNGSYRTLNLVGKTIDLCEKIGFIYKRDIIWQKTNGVKAPFGSYPYPGGILLNNMHEFILEFNKPISKNKKKYSHLTTKQKENSKLDKDFWLKIKKSDVWIMKPQGSGDRREHIAPFPQELPYRIIKAYSFESEHILDPFMGSGIALKIAADLKRNGIGYEINPLIAQKALKTFDNYQNI